MPRSTSDSTATTMVAAKVALGKKYKAGVRKTVAKVMPTAVKTPAAGVCAPASKFTTERAKPPVTGNPPVNAAEILLAPKANNSWSGSMRWRLLAASVCPTETDSTKPTTLISSAGTASDFQSAMSQSGAVKGGRPWGTVPTILRPCACQSKAQVRMVLAAMAATGPALATKSAGRASMPQRTSKGFKPLRTHHKNAMAVRPMHKASIWVLGI